MPEEKNKNNNTNKYKKIDISKNNKPELMSETFVNPYNFIPISGKCDRPEAKRKSEASNPEKRYTGYFDCSLRLLTPLLIPNTSCDQVIKGDYKSFDFFSYENLSALTPNNQYPAPPKAPVIPGSELRGVVRSVYEAAFRGCFSSVSQNQTLRRRASPKRPGILRKENGQWYLIPCSRAMLNVEHERKNGDYSCAERHGGLVQKEDYDQWKEGQRIYIQVSDKFYKASMKGIRVVKDYCPPSDYRKKEPSNSKEEEWLEGWLHKGEIFPARKHHESVFYGLTKKRIAVKDKDMILLKAVVEEYRNKKINRFVNENKSWYQDFPLNLDEKQDNKKGEELLTIPIYYDESSAENGGYLYLCPACIGKEIYEKNILKLLEQDNTGNYQPCSDSGSLCSCCRVFGMAAKGTSGEKGAYGSKVRFTDAVMKKEMDEKESREMFYKPVLLPEMGEPKPGTVEFYTKSPYCQEGKLQENGWGDSNGYWTYDYFCEKNGSKIIRHKLEDDLPELRGRKFYWHSNNWKNIIENDNKENSDDKKNKKMRQWMRPLREEASDREENSRFYFRVFFEKLTVQELSRLRWSLDFKNADCAHKIGHAKPLGFGSVKIEIQELALRSIDAAAGRWKICPMPLEEMNLLLDEERIDVEDKAVRTILVMANWKERPGDVSYPKACKIRGNQNANIKKKKNEDASHQWFRNNKKITKDGNDLNPAFGSVLPLAEEEMDKNKRLHTIGY